MLLVGGEYKKLFYFRSIVIHDNTGMTGEVKKAYVDTRINEKHCIERLPGGLLQIKSDSQWLKDGVLVIKTGEEYTMDIPGMGKITVSYMTTRARGQSWPSILLFGFGPFLHHFRQFVSIL